MSSSHGRGPGGQHPPSHGPKPASRPRLTTTRWPGCLGSTQIVVSTARWLGYGLGGTLAMVLCFGGAYALTALVRNTNPQSAAAPQEMEKQVREAIRPLTTSPANGEAGRQAGGAARRAPRGTPTSPSASRKGAHARTGSERARGPHERNRCKSSACSVLSGVRD